MLGPGDVVLVGRHSGGGALGDLVKKALTVVVTHFFAAQTMPLTAAAPNTQERIAVAGEVYNPRLYFYGPGMTVKDALDESSGLTPRADTAHLLLRRTGDVDALIPIDAVKALAGDPDQNQALQPGDTLYVPRLTRADMYAVFGAVKKLPSLRSAHRLRRHSGSLSMRRNSTVRTRRRSSSSMVCSVIRPQRTWKL
jgi:hypothetical protein